MQAVLSPKSQITLPKATRERLGVGPGDVIEFIDMPDGSVRIPPKRDLKSLRGFLKGRRKAPVTVEEMNEAIAEMGARAGSGA